jgi:hypothetical protein
MAPSANSPRCRSRLPAAVSRRAERGGVASRPGFYSVLPSSKMNNSRNYQHT